MVLGVLIAVQEWYKVIAVQKCDKVIAVQE